MPSGTFNFETGDTSEFDSATGDVVNDGTAFEGTYYGRSRKTVAGGEVSFVKTIVGVNANTPGTTCAATVRCRLRIAAYPSANTHCALGFRTSVSAFNIGLYFDTVGRWTASPNGTAGLVGAGTVLGAPSGVAVAAGTHPTGAHDYRCSYVTADGESQLGSIAVFGETGFTNPTPPPTYIGSIFRLTVPFGPTGTTSRKVYRKLSNRWRLAGSISDNTTATIDLQVIDASLGALPPPAYLGTTLPLNQWFEVVVTARIVNSSSAAARDDIATATVTLNGETVVGEVDSISAFAMSSLRLGSNATPSATANQHYDGLGEGDPATWQAENFELFVENMAVSALDIDTSEEHELRTPAMPPGSLAPYPRLQFLDENGAPYASGQLETYEGGISTELVVYEDEALATAHDNPVVLDSAGRATIYLDEERYKGILKDSAGKTIWSVDPIPATHIATSQFGETIPIEGSQEQGVSDAAYGSGAGAENLAPGTKILRIDSDDLIGTYKLRAMLKTDGGVVTLGIMNLSDGAPDTALREISSVSTVGEQVTSTAVITFAAGGTTKSYGVKLQVASGVGLAWGIELVRVT